MLFFQTLIFLFAPSKLSLPTTYTLSSIIEIPTALEVPLLDSIVASPFTQTVASLVCKLFAFNAYLLPTA